MNHSSVNAGRAVLSDLLGSIAWIDRQNDRPIQSLCLDSRKVKKGSLFFAVPGIKHDGRNYIDKAVRNGASAVAYEARNWDQLYSVETPLVAVDNLRSHLSSIADLFYHRPSAKLHVVGITGTNAKTSCAYFTAQALENLGRKCAVVGTLGAGFYRELNATSLTTPDAITLQQELAALSAKGAEFVCLEVSSHALDQDRVKAVRFNTVLFTNLSQDHLDYHVTNAHYRSSKEKLFVEHPADCAILNLDEEFGRCLVSKSKAAKIITYGASSQDVKLLTVQSSIQGLSIRVQIQGEVIELESSLVGRFNAANLTAVAAVLFSLGFSSQQIKSALEPVKGVPGRLEKVPASDPGKASVFIDYAHTPDALKTVLTSLREITKGNIWCVFGCGGDRDRSKRPQMGAFAERFADKVILTDDNPRSESPSAIMDEIAQGMNRSFLRIHDRRAAIAQAIKQAKCEDVVLVVGKGHETTQVYGKNSYAFNDKAVAIDLLRCKL